MEEDKKKYIEDISKSDYFDFVLEKQIQNKLSSLVKKYKWIGGLALAAIVFIGSLLGIEVRHLNQQKAEITSQFNAFKKEMTAIQEDMERKRADIENLRDFFNMFKEINDKYTEFYEGKYTDFNTQMRNNILEMQKLTEMAKTFRDETSLKLQNMSGDIESSQSNLNDILHDWDKERQEVIKISSTVYAYVERGNDREPGTKEYRPEFIDLPFSDKTMRVTFNAKRAYKEKNPDTGDEELVKEAELFITIFDRDLQLIRKDPYLVREKRPIEIPETEHTLEAQFIYLPPNPPFQRIPDFVILAVSLKPDAYERLIQKTMKTTE
jgi:hypothetical protein